MKITFQTGKMEKACSRQETMRKTYGNLASRLKQRLTELVAAETLADISHLPPARCHELTGERSGQFAVKLDANYRLIFRPDHAPIPSREDGGIDLARVTEICILEIVDYH